MTSESNIGDDFVNLKNMLFLTITCCSNKKRSDKRVAASGFCVHQCWSIGCKARRNRIEYKVLVQVLEVAVLVVVVAAVVDVY